MSIIIVTLVEQSLKVNYCNNKLFQVNYNYKLWQLFNEFKVFKHTQIVSFFIRGHGFY